MAATDKQDYHYTRHLDVVRFFSDLFSSFPLSHSFPFEMGKTSVSLALAHIYFADVQVKKSAPAFIKNVSLAQK